MKKIIYMIILSLSLLGCQSSKSLEDQQFDMYYEIKEQLMNQTHFDESNDFLISLVYNQMETSYRYDVIIDQPNVEMYHIIAMSYALEDDDTMCPNVGIFDEHDYHLKKNYVNKQEGYYKGIQLSGMTNKKQTIKLYISYSLDKENKNRIERYIEVKEE